MLRKTEKIGPLAHSSVHWLNPDQLPHVTSGVERFLLDVRGLTDGMLLTNGIEVCFAPYLSAEILGSVQPHDRVTVYGGLVGAVTVMSAVVIETVDGRRIVDDWSPAAEGNVKYREAQPPRRKLEVEALVRRALHGPTGEIRGGLLDDGTIVRFSPDGSGFVARLLRPASWLVARGEGIVTELGTVIDAVEVGPSRDSLRRVRA